MGGKYSDFVTELLEPDCGIDDQTFGSTDTEVWMKEDNALSL